MLRRYFKHSCLHQSKNTKYILYIYVEKKNNNYLKKLSKDLMYHKHINKKKKLYISKQ